jgi:hypothetical protein
MRSSSRTARLLVMTVTGRPRRLLVGGGAHRQGGAAVGTDQLAVAIQQP